MLQVRKLALAVAAATAFSSGIAHAVGMGGINVKSHLNQPLEAEIDLVELGGLTELEVKTNLASADDFNRAGVDRQFFLTNLKFTPVIKAGGKGVIKVTSERNVREPYLNFLVELIWPNGKILKEYTLLLDPPMYAPQEVVYKPAAATPADSRKQQTATTSKPKTPAATAASAARPKPLASGEQYRVQKNDTLWSIAARHSSGMSVQQTMLAIQDLNPHAFINGDINRLKAGQVLALPADADIQTRSKTEAMAELRQGAGVTPAPVETETTKQLDARHRTDAGAAPAQVEQQDTLRLVASDTGDAAVGNERGEGSSAALLAQLAEAKELLDSSNRENADLQDRVSELDSQIEKLNQLIELKNTQLASLQHLAATEEPEEALEDGLPAEQESTTELSAEKSETEISAVEGAGADKLEQPELETITEQEPSVSEPAVVTEPEPQQQEAVVSEVTPAPQAEEPAAEESLTDNPLFLPAVGGAALLALLLLLLVAAKRRKAKETELNLNVPEPVIGGGDDVIIAGHEAADDELPVVDSAVFEEFEQQLQAEPTQDMDFADDSDNTLAEADNYIAYGNFNQAQEVLMQAIDQQPQRLDLRLKLLEVLADLDDKNEFARQFDELHEMGAPAAEMEAIKERYPFMLEAAPIDSIPNLDDIGLEIDAADSAAPAMDADFGELDFDLDDELLAPETAVEPEPEIIEEAAQPLDLDSLLDPVSEEVVELDNAEESVELSFNTEIEDADFSEVTIEEEPAAALSDNFDFSEFEQANEIESGLDVALPEELDLSVTDAADDKLELGLGEVTGEQEVQLDELDDFSFELPEEQAQATEEQVIDELDALLDAESQPEEELEVSLEEVKADLSEPETASDIDFDAMLAEIEQAAEEDIAEELMPASDLESTFDELPQFEVDDLQLTDAEPAPLSEEVSPEQSIVEDDLLADLDALDELADLDFSSPELDEQPIETAELTEAIEAAAELEVPEFIAEEPALEPVTEEPEVAAEPEASREATFAALEEELEDDFSFLAGTDETTTKLDLARAYIEMGDDEGAKDILEEVLGEGTPEQQQDARELIEKLG